MKMPPSSTIYLLLLLAMAPIFGCGPSTPADMVIGTWKSAGSNGAAKSGPQPAGIRSGAAPGMSGTLGENVNASLEFSRDKSFNLKINALSVNGTWSYDESRQAFILYKSSENSGGGSAQSVANIDKAVTVFLDVETGEIELFLLNPDMAKGIRAMNQRIGKSSGIEMRKQ